MPKTSTHCRKYAIALKHKTVKTLRSRLYQANRHKKGQACYIAPLQPPTLAAVTPWGNSKGAGRIGLTRVQK